MQNIKDPHNNIDEGEQEIIYLRQTVVKIKGHNFTRVYPKPIFTKINAKNMHKCCHMYVCISNLKKGSFVAFRPMNCC